MTQQPKASLSLMQQAIEQYIADAASLSADEQRHIILAISSLLEACSRVTTHHLPDSDMQEISGQEHVKRAMEVAAAGEHAILLVGPPAAGKRLLARTLPSILPVAPQLYPFRAPDASIDLAAFQGASSPAKSHWPIMAFSCLKSWLPFLRSTCRCCDRSSRHESSTHKATKP